MEDASEFDKMSYFEAMNREIEFARALSRPVMVTWWLLAIIVVIFLSAYFYGLIFVSEAGFSKEFYQPLHLTLFPGMKVNEQIAGQGEWWRLISSMFVHLNAMHIGFNAYGLFVLGPLVEKFFGGRRFFIIFMVTGILSALASFYFNDVPSGGASGAIYGLVGALGVFGWRYRSELPPRVSRTFTVGMMPWVVIGIGIGFIPSIPFDNAAHIGGLIAGGIIAGLMRSRLDPRKSPIREYLATGASILFIGVCLWALAEWTAEFDACLPDRTTFMQCYPEITQRI